MTQSRLAEKLDYTSECQQQRIESRETSCSVDKLMELAQILGVSTDYLLFGYESACRDDMEKYMDTFTLDKHVITLENQTGRKSTYAGYWMLWYRIWVCC